MEKTRKNIDNTERIYSIKKSGFLINVENKSNEGNESGEDNKGNENNKYNKDKGVIVDMEEFIPCVLYAMLPYDYEEEALKTQIVIIRTYIMNKMIAEGLQNNKIIDSSDLGLPYITYSDMEKEWGKDYEYRYNFTLKMLNNTSLNVITFDNNIIYPYYHNISAGSTCCGEYPYLKSVESTEDVQAEGYLTITYYTSEEFISKINAIFSSTLTNDSVIEGITINKFEGSEYVSTVDVGGKIMTGEEFMKKMEIRSASFSIEKFAGGIKIVCRGTGEGKGLSIYGAARMASQGKSCIDILKYYYSGVELNNLENYYRISHSSGNIQ